MLCLSLSYKLPLLSSRVFLIERFYVLRHYLHFVLRLVLPGTTQQEFLLVAVREGGRFAKDGDTGN